jgi:arylsulfatase A-like enzyme
MRSLCLFSGPEIKPATVIAEPFSLMDVAPTVCDALRISPPLQADGRSIPQSIAAPEAPSAGVGLSGGPGQD